jgi:hypothetical protein
VLYPRIRHFEPLPSGDWHFALFADPGLFTVLHSAGLRAKRKAGRVARLRDGSQTRLRSLLLFLAWILGGVERMLQRDEVFARFEGVEHGLFSLQLFR